MDGWWGDGGGCDGLVSGSQFRFACETHLVQLYGLYLRLLTWIMCFLCSSQGVSRSPSPNRASKAPPVLPCVGPEAIFEGVFGAS